MANNSLIFNPAFNSFILPVLSNVLDLPKWIKIDKSILPETSCTSIVILNNYSTIAA